MTDRSDVTRRTLLAAAGSSALFALAGCSGSNASASTESKTSTSADANATTAPSTGESHGSEGGEDFADPSEVEALPTEAVDDATVEMTMVSEEEPVFDPEVIWVTPGGSVTWKNVDEEEHTATAYAPANDKPQRIPDGAESWDSGLLETGETFTETFETEGVYDYYCTPHEALGMLGTVVVGTPDTKGQPGLAPPQDGLPDKAKSTITDLNDRVTKVLSR